MANPWDNDLPASQETSKQSMPWDQDKVVSTKASAPWDEDEVVEKSSDTLGWKKFKASEVPGRVVGETVAAADVVANLPSFFGELGVGIAGQLAKTVAPAFGKSKESIDRETDVLKHQVHSAIGDPISRAAKSLGLKGKYVDQSKVSGGMQAIGEGKEALDTAAADTKVAKALGMGKREISLLTDIGLIGAGELAGKVAKPVTERLGEKMTTPNAKERAEYLERKTRNQKDFDFYNEQKTKEAKEKFDTEAEKAKKELQDFDLAKRPDVVDTETGEIKEPAKTPNQVHKTIGDELGITPETAQALVPTREAFNQFKKTYDDLKVNGATEADAIAGGLRTLHEDHIISTLMKESSDRKAAWEKVTEERKAKTEEQTAALLDSKKTKADEVRKDVEAREAEAAKEKSDAYLESIKQDTKVPAEDDIAKQVEAWERNSGIKDAIDDSNKASELLDTAIKEPTIDNLNKFLKENKKVLEQRAEAYFKESGIDPISGPTQDFKNWSEMVKDAIGVNMREVTWGDHRVKNLVKGITKALPKIEDRVKVFEAIQRHTVDALPENLKAVAKMYENTMKQWGKEFYDAGMLKGLLEDYASRIIKEGTDPSLINKAMEAFRAQMDANFGTTSKYQKSRVIDNYDLLLDTLEKHGIQIEKDLAKVAETYGKSMFKAKANAELIKYLKDFSLVDGYKVFLDTRDTRTPYGYKRITGGQFDGYAVHPDMYKPIRWVMDAKDMNMVMRAMHTLSSVTKRLNVGASLFHNTTLLVGSAFANSVKTNNYFNPVAHYKAMAEAYSKAYDSGRLRAWNDVGGNFGAEIDSGIGAMGHVAKSVDNWIAKAGGFEGDLTQKTVEWASKPQHLLDKITWDITHDGSKLLTMEALLEKAMIDHPGKSEAVLMKEIATHVNDVYGGIDWYGAARDSNKFLENLKMSAFSPEGRKYLQILEFAPDWTLSTLRVFSRAIPSNLLKPHEWNIAKGIEGLQKPFTAADHARRYQLRAMMYLFTVANALNISLSGHPITQNKDFFSIELGDGSAIHPFKHYSEAFHWLGDFNKTFINKLGFIPRWLVKSADKPWGEAWKEAAKGVLPFSITASGKGGVAEAIGGFAGVPVTGKHEGKLGGAGFQKNWERAMKRAQRKLGIPVKFEEDEE